jgi:hypothetical protein
MKKNTNKIKQCIFAAFTASFFLFSPNATFADGVANKNQGEVVEQTRSYEDVSERVTVGLYGVEGKSWEVALKEIDNIKKIYEGFKAAAKAREKSAPQIVLSAFLIPNWAGGSSFDSSNYNSQRKIFLTKLQKGLHEKGLSGVVTLEDFYAETSKDEQVYLNNLTARGSNADMIKMHAIIKNQHIGHLQMDSNTQIPSYQSLYDGTFGRDGLSNSGVILNANCYDSDYVSANNKIVYTKPESVFAKTLTEVHYAYCREHGEDSATSEEKTKRNSIYSKDFVKALSNLQLAREVHRKAKIVYAADMSKPEYRLTSLIITAVHQTWKDPATPQVLGDKDQLIKLYDISKNVLVRIGDAICDFASFETALRKYTGQLLLHASLEGGEEGAHESLLNISNTKAELYLIYSYLIELAKRLESDREMSLEEREALMRIVIKYIPDTPRGNKLTNELFGFTVEQLKENPFLILITKF